MSLNSKSSNRHLVQSVNDFDVTITPSEEMVMTESFEEQGDSNINDNIHCEDTANLNNSCSVIAINDDDIVYIFDDDDGDNNENDGDIVAPPDAESNYFESTNQISSVLEEPEPTPTRTSPVTIPAINTTTSTSEQQSEQRDDAFDLTSMAAPVEEEVIFESRANSKDSGDSSITDNDVDDQRDDHDSGNNTLHSNKSNEDFPSIDNLDGTTSNDEDDSWAFLQFLPSSLTVGGVRNGGGGDGGSSQLTSSSKLTTEGNDDNDDDANTTTTAESDILSPSDVSSVVDSVLEDLEQQKEARSAANARMQSLYQDRATIHATEEGVAELLFTLRTYARDGIVVVNNPQGRDELLQRVQDFHRARFLRREYGARHAETTTRSFGIYGLFQYVTELQLDLEWTEDAAWRRLNMKESFPWIEFQRVHKRKYRQPYFCYLLLVIWTVTLGLSLAFNEFNVAPLSENPFYGPPVQVLRDLGAVDRDLIVEENQWYRLVTSLVLHAGLIHYLINVMLMVFMGSAVEQAHGLDGTVIIYLLSGIGGNIISALFLGQSIGVGASGGLFGLLGVCVADIFTHWDLLTLKNYRDPNDPAHKGFNYKLVLVALVSQIILYLIIGLAPIVDNFCTFGGFFYGICLTVPILKWMGDGSGFFSSGNNNINRATGPKGMPRTWMHEANERQHRQQSACHLLCASVSIFVLVASTLLLAKGQKGEVVCKNCRYVSCVPFPWWDDKNDNNGTDSRWWHCDDCDFAPLKSDVYYRENVTTLVNMTCPNDEVVTIDLLTPNVDMDEIDKDLGGYCRQYCEL
jgi:membrane associated rhomboid family serine protease